MSILSKADKTPGFIRGSLINIFEFDSKMLSEYGLEYAREFKTAKDKHEENLKHAAKELDDLFEEE